MKAWLGAIRSYLKRPQPVAVISDALRAATEKDNHIRDLEMMNRRLLSAVEASEPQATPQQLDAWGRVAELIEARQMAGTGPWHVNAETLQRTDELIKFAASRIEPKHFKETIPAGAGATGDIELALQNVEWRREINLSWLEFSRWGIQQLILISRLHYIKNPWIQRAINVVAAYIFGRGVEVMSEDDDANKVLADFFERNKKIVGQAALADLQKRLQYDGQVFFIFFPDAISQGKTNVRTIDATEIFEIITNPDDSDEVWLYHRRWTQKVFNMDSGSYITTKERDAYYPALDWEPTDQQKAANTINDVPVEWQTPVLHHRGGTGVAKWHFDCPKAYAALDWAKAGRKWLEACATVRLSLAQFSMTLNTKGGQQALEGAKQQLETTVGPTSNLYDKNPTAVLGSIFAAGPGTTLSAFNSSNAGGDPKDVAEYRAMVANVFEIPATWLGDYTAILATATTLDRPTELGMLEKQERWREVLVRMAQAVLRFSQMSASGVLKEAGKSEWLVVHMERKVSFNGQRVYVKLDEAAKKQAKVIAIKVNFPAIREGDMPALVKAITEAMTLDNKVGQIVGIDERIGVGLLFEQLGVEDYGDILDEMYPETGDDKYDPSRTKEPLPPPLPTKGVPNPGGSPQAPGGVPVVPGQNAPTPVAPGAPAAPAKAAERLIRALAKVKEKRNASNK